MVKCEGIQYCHIAIVVVYCVSYFQINRSNDQACFCNIFHPKTPVIRFFEALQSSLGLKQN